MAQFDVHRNRGQNHDAIPYVVIVQSSIFDDYRRRVVVPLVKKSYLDSVELITRAHG
jgi:toxin CcdB